MKVFLTAGRQWRTPYPTAYHPSQPSWSPSPPHRYTYAYGGGGGGGGGGERERDREWREWRDRSWEREGARRGRGRQLPPTPTKPSTLHVHNAKQQPPFARISHSPSHLSLRHTHTLREPVEPLHDEYEYGREVERLIHRDYRSRERRGRGYESERERERERGVRGYEAPLSYEAALALGRGGARALPSPAPAGPRLPNGYKPRARHSDSDEDDWC